MYGKMAQGQESLTNPISPHAKQIRLQKSVHVEGVHVCMYCFVLRPRKIPPQASVNENITGTPLPLLVGPGSKVVHAYQNLGSASFKRLRCSTLTINNVPQH